MDAIPTLSRIVAARVLMAGGLVSFFSPPAILIYPFGIFAIAIAQDAGLPKQQIAALIGPVILLTIPFTPVMGWVIQRFHTPTVAVLALLGSGSGLLLLSIGWTTPIFVFALTLGIASLLSQFANPGVTGALILQNFDSRRGLALGIVSAFTGLGVAVVPVADTWMIGQWGWRVAFAVSGGVILLAALANLLLLRGITGSKAASPAGDQSMGAVLKESFAYLRKNPTFWLLAGFFFLLVVVANAMPLHLPLILEERGAPPNIRALSLTATGVTMLVARPLMGWVLDWLPVRWVLALMVAGPLAGTLGLLLSGSTTVAMISSGGFGMALGGEIVCLSFILSRAFPEERFGSTYGWFMLVLAVSAGAGPIAISTLVSLGGYDAALAMMLGASTLAFILCFFFKDVRAQPIAAGLVQQGI